MPTLSEHGIHPNDDAITMVSINWKGEVLASRHDYAEFHGNLELDDLPNKFGVQAPRQQQIKDRLVRSNAEDIHDSPPVSGAQSIRWNGDNSKGLVTITRNLEQPRQPMRFENPMHDQIVHLHPIEVQLTPFAIHQMRQVSLAVCKISGDSTDPTEVLETGGLLGGTPKQDSNKRWYTEIEYSYADESQYGTEASFTFTPEMKKNMEHELAIRNLHNVGFWHSHPSYGPFQSDARLQSYGADVQATHGMCGPWWSAALVIDPMSGPQKNQLSLGAYKINGLYDSLGTDGTQVVGWRSVGIGVRKLQSFDYITSRLSSQDLSSLERQSLQFELDFYKSSAEACIDKANEDIEQNVSKIIRKLNSSEYPLIQGMNTKGAQKLYELCMRKQSYVNVEQKKDDLVDSVDWSDSNPSKAGVSNQQEEE